MTLSTLNTSSQFVKDSIEQISNNNYLPPRGSKIAVGMSGGVDSSVTAALLTVMGYEVTGMTGLLADHTNKTCDGGRIEAMKVAEQIGIEHLTIDLREIFEPTIIKPFINAYSEGRTPVPCMTCNTEIKWGSLLHHSKELGASHFASGHYVRLMEHSETADFHSGFSIARPADHSKDQSFMLWTLDQEKMSRAFYPLANFGKDQTRQLAAELGLVNADRPESMDICFVPNKTSEYLKEKIGERPGEIKHIEDQRVMGEHSGTHFYTIGQRKGIGVSHPTPLYVVKIDALNNIVYVGGNDDLFSRSLIAEHMNWHIKPKGESFRALVKIRYASAPALATINLKDDLSTEIIFDDAQSSVTPGQAAVIYDETDAFIIGGGWISDQIKK